MEEADFSGWATKNDLKCSDGRTIIKDAFAHQDKQKVPLVWQHQHNDSVNILGHAFLENRAFGVYAYGFFNDTPSGANAKALVQHGDIKSLSIFANNLKQRGGEVLHGDIRELSLVLAGANPGAFIDNVSLAHADDEESVYEAIVYTGLSLEHENMGDPEMPKAPTIEHAQKTEFAPEEVESIFDTMSEEQQTLTHWLVGEALKSSSAEGGDTLAQSAINEENVLAHLDTELQKGFDNIMTHRIFEQGVQNGGAPAGPTLSHDQLRTIIEDAKRPGETLKSSFLAHAVEYGIENIDILFPDAKAVSNTPEVIGRRTEWVADVINSTKHSPMSRIKSTAVDLTADEARAKGYVKATRKKEEVIKLLKRVTTPKMIYKKQKLDREDIIDITDLNVVAWLKAEMRLMLEEELARAILIGDGREPEDEDKIDEDHLRPIAWDDDMYAHQLTVPANQAPEATTEAIIRARVHYKGTGTPTLYTTDAVLTDLILQKDKMGRYLYETEAALAAKLRVNRIVTVEVMQDTPQIIGIIVNLADYTLGADRGGEISMFDDFDIDYNQYKYLIETRVSGALTKPKSAVVIKQTVGTLVSPDMPQYNATTHVIAIPSKQGVVYQIDGVTRTGNVTITETTTVDAIPASSYSFPHNTTSEWTFPFTA
jgi:hypothetical protein